MIPANNTPYELAGKRVWVAGHKGLVGSALVKRLADEKCKILTVDRGELDLRRQAGVEAWLHQHKPQVIFAAAATVGGIQANSMRPAEFIFDNLTIITNIVHAAHLANVEKLMVLGSSCIYPRLADQPIHEDTMMTGPFEPTNRWYATAKVAGIMLADGYRQQFNRDYISVVPTNLYGPGDNFDPAASHVIPAIIHKILKAKQEGGEVDVWGTGTPEREFLFIDDAADAMIFLMKSYSSDEIINIAGVESVSIGELTSIIAKLLDYQGNFKFDHSKPDGMPKKILSANRLTALGWRPNTPLLHGLKITIDWYLAHCS
jgi:GDP-L-fucose synthase